MLEGESVRRSYRLFVGFAEEFALISLPIAFMLGMVVGGLFVQRESMIIMLGLTGGPLPAITWGETRGYHPVYSLALVFIAQALTTLFLSEVAHFMKNAVASELGPSRLGRGGASFLAFFRGSAKRVGVIASLILITFLFGFWSVVVAELEAVARRTALKSICFGFLVADAFYLMVLQGLSRYAPTDLILTFSLILVLVLVGKDVILSLLRASRKNQVERP